MLAHPRGGSSVDILTTDREEQFLKVVAWDLRDSGGRKDVDWTITVKEGEGALEEILRDKMGGPGNVVEHCGDHDLTLWRSRSEVSRTRNRHFPDPAAWMHLCGVRT